MFLTGPRNEILDPYFQIRKKKGRPLIPIGLQVLYLDKMERKQSKRLNEMIVLTFRHDPEETESGKVSFHPIIQYNLTDYSYKKACDQKGLPFGITKIKQFFLDAYGYQFSRQGKTVDELLDGMIEQGMKFKKVEFNAVVRHKMTLAKNMEGEVVTKQRGSMVTIGQPILNYEPDIWMVSKIDTPIELPVELHEKLIVPLSTEDQNTYSKLFNEKIECDYKQGFLSTNETNNGDVPTWK